MMAAVVDPEQAARGAKNVVEQCLVPRPGERVHVIAFKAERLPRLVERAVREAGGEAVSVEIDALDKDEPVEELVRKLEPRLAGVTAAVFLAPVRPPQTLSVAVAKVTETAGARMLYLLQVDERLLSQSARARPEALDTINQRLVAALAPPVTLRVSSDGGTDLELVLAPHHALVTACGRPGPGKSENLPSGYVYTHPSRANGVFVADRAVFGPKGDVDRSLLRRAPIRFEIQNGRVTGHDAADPAAAAVIDRYLESHVSAGRLGLVIFPTNYLVRSEIGSERQDMLLPGVTLSLGFADPRSTGATYLAPVQLVLLGRRLTVEAGPRRLVDAGRMEDALVEGIDPFR